MAQAKRTIEEIRTHRLMELEKAHTRINDEARALRIEETSLAGIQKHLTNEGHSPQALRLIEKIGTYLTHSETLIVELKHADTEIQINLLKQIRAERAVRKAERADYWINWGQRTLRWIVGVGLVVLLYSSTVWLSEKNDFIKVPVKDWVQDTKQLTSDAD